MSMKPDQIVVGHVYRGPRTELSSGAEREVTWEQGGVVYFRRPLAYGAQVWSLAIEKFARWATADITQEDKANG